MLVEGVEEFCNQYLTSMQVKYDNIDIEFYGGGSSTKIARQTRIECTMTVCSLNELASNMKRLSDEKRARESNPAVQHAYEQYQLLLTLTK